MRAFPAQGWDGWLFSMVDYAEGRTRDRWIADNAEAACWPRTLTPRWIRV